MTQRILRDHTTATPTRRTAGACFRDGDVVTSWLLGWFSPFNELTDAQREIVAGYETVRELEAGARLVEPGFEDDACIYLVEGKVALVAEDGATMHVSGGTKRSRLPVSGLMPREHTVTAMTDVSVIAFSRTFTGKINEAARTYVSS